MRSIGGAQLARQVGDWSGAGPGYARLAAAIRLLVLDGRLALDTRLPGERDLAAALGVSRTTVTAAYDSLRSAGYAISKQGSGTRTALPPARSGEGVASWTPFGPDGSELLDLAHASPEAPAHSLRRAYDSALRQLPRHLPTPGYNLFGLPELRTAIADRYAVRGLPTRPEQILVTAGAQHAFTLVLSLVVNAGDRVLVEHPTYPNALDAIAQRNARPVPVALTDSGWDVGAIGAAVRQAAPRLAYLVPDFNNPTGLLASDAERAELAGVLARSRTLTVLDETLTELALDGAMPPPLAGYLPADLAVTIGSASKTLWGGLRVGWVRAGTATIRRLAALRAACDMSSPVLEQLAVAELLTELDEVLPGRRADLRHRRDTLLAALARHLPEWSVRVPGGGLALWCDLGEAVSSRLVGTAERQGIRLAAGPRFGVDGAFERWLRLPYTHPPEVLDDAAGRLAQAFRAATSGAVSAEHSLDSFA